MSTTVGRRKKRLSREELDAAERVLRKKYRHIMAGTLKNVSAVGSHAGKRTVEIACANCSGHRKVATSDLAQVKHCSDCTDQRRAEKRRSKPKPR